MKALKLVAILAMVLASFSAQAICPVQNTSIFYINGADNERRDAEKSAERLGQALKRKINPECVTVSYAYNQTQGRIDDLLEVFRQESLEEILTPTNFWEMFERLTVARPLFTNLMGAAFFVAPRAEPDPEDVEIFRQIREHLDTLYRVAPHKDNQLIFVGHSAGNYFANEERLAMTEEERNRTKIVSVATLANNVAGASGPYTTVSQDLYVASYVGALIPNLANVGTCTDDWACHGWLTSYMVPGSNSRTKIVADIIAVLPTVPVLPTTEVLYLRLTTGNPGVPGDGILVNSGGTLGDSTFELQPPFSLQGITNGITVSVFPPNNTPFQNLGFAILFSVKDKPILGCSFAINFGGVPTTPSVNGVAGLGVILSQDFLNEVVGFIRISPVCGNTTVDDLFVAGITLSVSGNVINPFVRQVDAIAVGIGENVFPTDATPVP